MLSRDFAAWRLCFRRENTAEFPVKVSSMTRLAMYYERSVNHVDISCFAFLVHGRKFNKRDSEIAGADQVWLHRELMNYGKDHTSPWLKNIHHAPVYSTWTSVAMLFTHGTNVAHRGTIEQPGERFKNQTGESTPGKLNSGWFKCKKAEAVLRRSRVKDRLLWINTVLAPCLSKHGHFHRRPMAQEKMNDTSSCLHNWTQTSDF